jgi:hypothetical protein
MGAAFSSRRASVEALAASHRQAEAALAEAPTSKDAAIAKVEAMRQALQQGGITAEQYVAQVLDTAAAVECFSAARKVVGVTDLTGYLDSPRDKARQAKARADQLADSMRNGKASTEQVRDAARNAAETQGA